MPNMTPTEYAAFMRGLVATAPAKQYVGEAIVGVIAEDAIKATYGSDNLRDLEPSTQAERESLGYTPNDPLVRTGELLRDTIATEHAPGLVAVGTPEVIAAYQEYGYFNVRAGRFVEPRPAFGIGTVEAQPAVEATMLATARAIAAGDVRELEARRATASVTAEGERTA